MSKIENTSQIKAGYTVKTNTNSGKKTDDVTDFASMLTKCQGKTGQDGKAEEAKPDGTKKTEGGKKENQVKKKNTQEKETQGTEAPHVLVLESEVPGVGVPEIAIPGNGVPENNIPDISNEAPAAGENAVEAAQFQAAASYAAEMGYRTFVQMSAENNSTAFGDIDNISNISDIGSNAVQALSALQSEDSPDTEVKLQETVPDMVQQTEEPVQSGETEQSAHSETRAEAAPVSADRTPGQREEQSMEENTEEGQGDILSGRDVSFLASAVRKDNVETFAAEKASVDTGAGTVKTSEDTLTEDLGQYLDTKISTKAGKLEISLEPEHLGKLTIRLEYEKGKTEVTIFSSSAKTLEILSKEAGNLARILEDKTGTPTVIYTPDQTQNGENLDEHASQNQGGRQEHREQRQKPDDSFAQQLRLGLA